MRRILLVIVAATLVCAAAPATAGTPPPPEVPFSLTPPSPIAYGSLCLGLTKVAGILITNTSTNGNPVPIDVTAITSDHPSEFVTKPPTLPKRLQRGESFSFTVTFKPLSRGAKTANISVTAQRADGTGSPSTQTEQATGNGIDRQISVAPNSLAFGGAEVGTTSAPRHVTIANGGGDPLTISTLTITGTNAKEFSRSPSPPLTIAAGTSKAISVSFHPSAIGSRSASLSLKSNSCNQPSARTVSLTGRGTHGEIEVSPTTVTLSTVPKKESDPSTITVKNVGEAPLTVSSIKITGDVTKQFELQVVPTIPARIGGGAQITFDVVFHPVKKTLPPPTATVEITSDDTETPIVKVEVKSAWATPSPSPSPKASPSLSPSPSASPSASVLAAPRKRGGGGAGSIGDYVSVVVAGGGSIGVFALMFALRSAKRRRVIQRWRAG